MCEFSFELPAVIGSLVDIELLKEKTMRSIDTQHHSMSQMSSIVRTMQFGI